MHYYLQWRGLPTPLQQKELEQAIAATYHPNAPDATVPGAPTRSSTSPPDPGSRSTSITLVDQAKSTAACAAREASPELMTLLQMLGSSVLVDDRTIVERSMWGGSCPLLVLFTAVTLAQ